MVVYKIIHPFNDKSYVGRTVQSLEARMKAHVRDSKTKDYPLYRAMRKYGPKNFNIEEIDRATSLSELNKKEADWMIKLNSMAYQNGYNLRSEDMRLRTSKMTRDKISKAMIGKKKIQHISNEEKSKIARENGVKAYFTKEKKEEWAIKNGSKPFKVYKAICKQFRKRNQPSIYKKGEYVGEWLMTTECAKDLDINRRHVGDCLNKKRKQHKGFMFERIKGEL